MSRPDVIVVGLGAVGSAALYQLARRGVRALGIDRFQPPHDQGSSHGETRITRLAIGEGAPYVQFVRRAHQTWRELEAVTGRSLLCSVGGLVFGSAGTCGAAHGRGDFLETTIEVAEKHGIVHEVLEGAALGNRFPQFRWRGDERGYFEPEAGFVRPEECIAAQLESAARLGAEIVTGERVMAWKSSGAGVEVTTERGRYEAAKVILSAGSWLPSWMPALRERGGVYRQVLFWFEPDGPHEIFTLERMPVFIHVAEKQEEMFYGFPAIGGPGGGLKIAGEQFNRETAPDDLQREVAPGEAAAMHALAAPHLRITSRCVRAVACKYTMMPDFKFVIDRYPESEHVLFASACSGHGFKHSAGVGEALAELAVNGATQFDLSEFSFGELLARSPFEP